LIASQPDNCHQIAEQRRDRFRLWALMTTDTRKPAYAKEARLFEKRAEGRKRWQFTGRKAAQNIQPAVLLPERFPQIARTRASSETGILPKRDT
jgi:hypothetical protein